MKVVGLCGGSGSGKGTVANVFLSYGIPNIDADAVYHDLVSNKTPCLEAIVREFGTVILNNEGLLDRKTLAKIVFSNTEDDSKIRALNRISHKFVLDKIRETLDFYKKSGTSAVIVDAPLLFESGFDKECDIIIAVIADYEEKVSRIMKRDSISEENAKERINKQLPDSYLIQKADYVINNCGTLSDVEAKIKTIYEKIIAT